MNFWTFADRNALLLFGLACLAMSALVDVFGSGERSGCRVHYESAPALDAGAP